MEKKKRPEQLVLFDVDLCSVTLVVCFDCNRPVPLYLAVQLGEQDICRDCFALRASKSVEDI